ncbi:MAG: hypothetical protein IJK02_07430 [Clostridia bacterium]|nr:hypothetical protein [Clostridia bacterium]
MNKPLNSIRVSVPNWLDEDAFSKLLAFLGEYRDVVQQVAFFSSDFHPPQPLETARRHADVLKDRIARVKAAGFSCGINILSTIGHHPERTDEMLQGDWRRMTGIDGDVCAGSFCPGDVRYIEEYVKPLYRIYCEAAPDFIWVDDDVRYGHIPVGNGCFCDGCINAFNLRCGCCFTRETLKAALTAPGNTALRKQWLTSQSDKLASLLAAIREIVAAYGPSITLGFMTGERYFEGYDFEKWARSLSGDGQKEIFWRPGGGAYTDRPLEGLLEKARQIGRQCARLPAYVTSVQSEIENFPYRVLQKSPRATALEVLLHTAAGCTGAALNVLPDAPRGEEIEVMRPHFEALRSIVPFERLLSETLSRAPTAGIYDGWHIHGQAALDGDFLTGSGGRFPAAAEEIWSLGLPVCHDPEHAAAFILTGKSPLAFSDEERRHMLSSGVFLDAEALDTLNALGYSELTGFLSGPALPEDSVEVCAQHPLNDGFAGKTRLCPQVFMHGTSRALIPRPGAETLCFPEDHHGKTKAACSMGLYQNRLGGRVCAAAHYALTGLTDTHKSLQIKRVFRFLSGDTLPFLPVGCTRLQAVTRRTARGDATVIFNPNLDTLYNTEILVGGSPNTLVFTSETGFTATLSPTRRDGNMTAFLLPELAPFSVALIRRIE